MLLAGKNAIITGASRGIGKAMVEVFSQEGANIWAFARTPSDAMESFCKDLTSKNQASIWPVYCELTDSVALKSAVMKVSAQKLPVDILVNNAGIVGNPHLFQMTSISAMREVFDVNFFAMMEMTQLVSRLMLRQKYGTIINVASVAGLDGDPAQVEYAASKAAVIGATKKLAIEFGTYGIRVNAIAPGLTDTDMGGMMDPEMEKKTLLKTILRRKGTPEEIAHATAFLASDMASYITGQVLRVDGGIL